MDWPSASSTASAPERRPSTFSMLERYNSSEDAARGQAARAVVMQEGVKDQRAAWRRKNCWSFPER
jgi:hypothetical protein